MVITDQDLLRIAKNTRAAVYVAPEIPDADRGRLSVAEIHLVGLCELVIKPHGVARFILSYLTIQHGVSYETIIQKKACAGRLELDDLCRNRIDVCLWNYIQ